MTSQPLPQPAPIPHRQRLLALLALLLAFGLRLYHLGGESLWYDETVSVFLAGKPLPELIAHTARDIHPPGYYLLLYAWAQIARPELGNGLEFLYAWPSLFWGVLLLPLLYALGRRLCSRRVALTALWLTAVNPYHIWYSQEVRMYTLGAGLGLLCLWAAGPFWQGSRPGWRGLLLYAAAAAAGLYTLYYFAFLLVGLNLAVLWVNGRAARRLGGWLGANLAVLLLWLPWLPIFWRQMTDPPVPPWRGALSLATVAQETLAALLVGQSPPLGMLWFWAGLAGLLLVALFWPRRSPRTAQSGLLAGFVFLPLLLILLISLTATPLYHIRYFFTYAAAGTLLLALAVEKLAGRRRWLHAMLIGVVFAAGGWGLHEFWTNPLYRADDHRGAVAELAARWRPGDAVLVNAGWAYTALAVYWPASPTAAGAQPAGLPVRRRLIDYAQDNQPVEAKRPLLLLGGSVDGSPRLGWGLAESDFYAISQSENRAALETVAARHPRIWHYRLYDTVSDPDSVVRAWLDERTTQRLDQPYPGRDYLRVQLFETDALRDPAFCPQAAAPLAHFGPGVHLLGAAISPDNRAGASVYATLCWAVEPDIDRESLRTSLRLYDGSGPDARLLAQQDEAPSLNLATRSSHLTPLALPLPSTVAPGSYRLELIVYDGRNGEPLPVDDPAAIFGQRWPLEVALFVGPGGE